MPRFEWPWVLLLLLAVPLLVRRAAHSRAFPFNQAALGLPRSRWQRWAALPRFLRAAALVLLILALSGPRANGRRVRDISNTIALNFALDCSGSMDAHDMEYNSRRMSRIDVVREVSRAFIFGDPELGGRPDDMIGVVSFAEDAVTLCPLTLDHEKVRPVLDRLRIAQRAAGTAIGDALAVAAARIRSTESASGETFRGKAVILITDGENNSGDRSPLAAARLARSWGVRVYAIGIRPGNADLSGGELEAIAQATGGVSRVAGTGDALREVYREINKLERAQRSVPHFSGGWEWIYALLGVALTLLATEVAISQTWLRRIP